MLLDYGYVRFVRYRDCGATTCSSTAPKPCAPPPHLELYLQRLIGHNPNGEGVLYCHSWNPAWDLYGLVSASQPVHFGGGGKAHCDPCRTQAALRVSEISGAIFKKYNTYPDALEAFNNAARDGKVRAVQVDPDPEAELSPGSQVRQQAPHEYPVGVRSIILHSATRPGQSFHKSRATRSSTGAGMIPSIYASQSDLAERAGHGTTCTEPREYQRFGQPSRKVPHIHVQNESDLMLYC
jgi:hypothetical protein